MISVTDSAFRQLKLLVEERGDPAKTGLRISIEQGGCAGRQYAMHLDAPRAGDEISAQDGVQIMIDAESGRLLDGATIDYADDLAGAGFRIRNPNAARSCGCGTSFEPADAEAAAGASR